MPNPEQIAGRHVVILDDILDEGHTMAAISEKLAAAEAALAEARKGAMAGIEKVAAEAAQDIVAKVSGAKVTAAKAGSAVKAVFANG